MLCACVYNARNLHCSWCISCSEGLTTARLLGRVSSAFVSSVSQHRLLFAFIEWLGRGSVHHHVVTIGRFYL
jgi:hypothetical protein